MPKDCSVNLRPCGKRYTNNLGVYTRDKCILHMKAQIINLLGLEKVVYVNKTVFLGNNKRFVKPCFPSRKTYFKTEKIIKKIKEIIR